MNTSLECEKCGGELNILEDGVTAVCKFCRHKTVWKEKKGVELIMALNRANKMRRSNRFSEAIQEYKVITDQNPEDAEAWWGLTLSTYGIEYVQDPRTGSPIPTCHRTITGSILKDSYFLNAQKNAQADQRESYLTQAQEIDRLQQEIKRKMDEEEDFDVFISFKATGADGERTADSYLARRIYDELTKRNIKTFFSDVTLHGKIADDFEPIIYRALFSCKFFVLVGTSAENINATWVKNEWSRFEKRMEDEKLSGVACAVFDSRKVRISELPPFLRTQGVDLKNYQAGGYEIDIADTVEKKTGRSKLKEEERRQELLRQMEEAQLRVQREFEEKLKNVASAGGGGATETVSSLLTCAEQELAAGEFNNAADYFKQVRNRDPMNDSAWWGFFLVEFGAKHENELLQIMDCDLEKKIEASRNFRSANQYLSDKNKERVNGFISKMRAPSLWWGRFLKEMRVSDEMQLCGKNISSKIINDVKSSENYKNANKYADTEYRARIDRFNEVLESPESNWLLFLKDNNVSREDEILARISADNLEKIESNACFNNARQRATGELKTKIDAFCYALHSSEIWWGLFLQEFRIPNENVLLDNFGTDLRDKLKNSRNYCNAKRFANGNAEYTQRIAQFEKQIAFQEDAYNKGRQLWYKISSEYGKSGEGGGRKRSAASDTKGNGKDAGLEIGVFLDEEPEYKEALDYARQSHIASFIEQIENKGKTQRRNEKRRVSEINNKIITAQKCRSKIIAGNITFGILCVLFVALEAVLGFVDFAASFGLTGNGFVAKLFTAFNWSNMSLGIKLAFALVLANGILIQLDLAIRFTNAYRKDKTWSGGTGARVRTLIMQIFFYALVVAAQYIFFEMKPAYFGQSLGIAQYGSLIIIALGMGALWVKYGWFKSILAFIISAAYHAVFFVVYYCFPLYELSAWMELVPLLYAGIPLVINLAIARTRAFVMNINLFMIAAALLVSVGIIIWHFDAYTEMLGYNGIITVEGYYFAGWMMKWYFLGGIVGTVIVTVVFSVIAGSVRRRYLRSRNNKRGKRG